MIVLGLLDSVGWKGKVAEVARAETAAASSKPQPATLLSSASCPQSNQPQMHPTRANQKRIAQHTERLPAG